MDQKEFNECIKDMVVFDDLESIVNDFMANRKSDYSHIDSGCTMSLETRVMLLESKVKSHELLINSLIERIEKLEFLVSRLKKND